MKVTLSQIQAVFDSFLLMKDRDVVRLSIAAILGNQMHMRRPIWLMLVAPPSSGKTTVLNAFYEMEVFSKVGEKVQIVHNISDLTENSFASGFKRPGKQTSLLYRMPYGGVMVFKDFTSILSKRAEAKVVIMSQLREIYDGQYTKLVGTGDDIHWSGKLGAVAGVTQAVYEHLESMSVMGDRFMLYQIPQPDRKEMLKFKIRQERLGITEQTEMPKAKELVKEYIQLAFDEMTSEAVVISPEDEEEIIDVADFCTKVRSGIITNDFSGDIEFVPEPEMPARMFEQMIALASIFIFMRKMDDPESGNSLTPEDYRLIYKIAFDSIPIKRRIALRYLAQYTNGVDTAGLAKKIGYPTKVVSGWLEQLTALGVAKRKAGRTSGNYWLLRDEYKDIMQKLESVKVMDGTLMEEDVDGETEVDRHWNQTMDVGTIQESIDNDEW